MLGGTSVRPIDKRLIDSASTDCKIFSVLQVLKSAKGFKVIQYDNS